MYNSSSMLNIFHREPTMLTCVFHGSCADAALTEYKRVEKEHRVMALVQFGLITYEGKLE